MGGDKAPDAILKGCWEAAPLLNGGDKVLLVGDETIIKKGLDGSGLDATGRAHFSVVGTTEVIAMDDPPVEAVRSKPNSSISVMCKLASKGEADEVVLAGEKGAWVGGVDVRTRVVDGVVWLGNARVFSGIQEAVGFLELGADN